MLVNETEAKSGKLCPYTLSSNPHNCVGSRCMGWRWLDEKNQGEERRGYCGLGGELGTT